MSCYSHPKHFPTSAVWLYFVVSLFASCYPSMLGFEFGNFRCERMYLICLSMSTLFHSVLNILDLTIYMRFSCVHFFFTADSISSYHIFIFYSSFEIQSGCFYLLAVVYSIAMSIGEQVSV